MLNIFKVKNFSSLYSFNKCMYSVQFSCTSVMQNIYSNMFIFLYSFWVNVRLTMQKERILLKMLLGNERYVYVIVASCKDLMMLKFKSYFPSLNLHRRSK